MKYLAVLLAMPVFACALLTPAAAQRPELLMEEGGAVENPPESLQLEYKLKTGDMKKYDITITGDGVVRFPGQEEQVKLEARTTMRCVRTVGTQITSTGAWRIEWDTIKATMLIPEFGDVYITVPHIEYEMDKFGKVQKFKGLDELAVCPGLPQQKTLGDVLGQLAAGGFPSKAVKPEDTWEDLYQIELPNQKPVRIVLKSKFLGFERIKNMDCVKIQSNYETPFTLDVTELKKPVDPKDDKRSQAVATDTAAKPQILSGTEKGEYCTYFAYKEGIVSQVYGTVELTADNKSQDPKLGSKPAGDETEPEAKKPEHDISVTYQLVSLLFTGKDEEGTGEEIEQ